ncbi:MAG: hypothetical protein ACE5HC_07340 [Candidatus Binatia bacterium]
MLTSFLHLLALVFYVGSAIGLWLSLISCLSVIKDYQEQIKILVRSLKVYNPVQTAALGLLVLSGAFQLTDLKAAYREHFIQALGMILGLKLFLAFFLILLSTYQSMGVGHRFVRRIESGEDVSPQEFQSTIRRLKSSAILIVCLAVIIMWLGLRMRGL